MTFQAETVCASQNFALIKFKDDIGLKLSFPPGLVKILLNTSENNNGA